MQKYGGTSVATAHHLRNVAARVRRAREAGENLVVVVSAMGGTTDQLLRQASELSPSPAVRELDLLLATGEERAAALLAIALDASGTKATALTGAQAGLRVTGHHGSAMISSIETGRMRQLLRAGRVVVVAGYQGMNQAGDVMTLGRGGSDTTAVALAAALGAKRCEIYTDVDGIYTADPRLVPDARRIPVISSVEMAEMAWCGARVMHTRAVELATLYDVPICIRSSFGDGPGTLITGGLTGGIVDQVETRGTIVGIAHDPEVARVTLCAVRTDPTTIGHLLTMLAEGAVKVDIVVESASSDGVSDISFTVGSADFDQAMQLAEARAESLGGWAEGEQRLGKVSVVGIGLLSRPDQVAKAFRSLGAEGIPIKLMSTSEARVSAVVPVERLAEAVRALHRAFAHAGVGELELSVPA